MTSDENFDAVRRFVAAFNRLDLGSVVDHLNPDVELHEWPEAPGARSYRGPEGVQQALETWFEVWEWMWLEIEGLVASGDHVLVMLHQRAKGKGSAVEVEIRTFNVYTLRDSKLVRIELFTEEEPALLAAGLDPGRAGGELEGLRQVNDAITRRDLAAVGELVDPDIVWEHNLGVGSPEEGIYHGRESLIALLERILEPWEHLRTVPRQVQVLGEGTYRVDGELHAKHRTSQTEVVTQYEQTLEMQEGLLARGAMRTGSVAPAGRSSAR